MLFNDWNATPACGEWRPLIYKMKKNLFFLKLECFVLTYLIFFFAGNSDALGAWILFLAHSSKELSFSLLWMVCFARFLHRVLKRFLTALSVLHLTKNTKHEIKLPGFSIDQYSTDLSKIKKIYKGKWKSVSTFQEPPWRFQSIYYRKYSEPAP